MNIKEALQKLTENGGEQYCKICIVDAINETERTVDVSPIDESAPILGVNLQANQNGETGIVCFPKQGSFVVVSFLNNSAAIVVLTEQVEKVCAYIGENKPVELVAEKSSLRITIGDTTIEADGEKEITFNGGENGGLVVIQKLTDSINALVDTFNNHTHILASSSVTVVGSATTQTNTVPITVPAITGKANKLNKSDYENKNIKHG